LADMFFGWLSWIRAVLHSGGMVSFACSKKCSNSYIQQGNSNNCIVQGDS